MADMRTIATAWEARATDLNRYNAAGAITAITRCSNLIVQGSLSSAVTPTYIKLLPEHDGWGNELKFYADQPWNDSKAAGNYIVWSASRNGDSNGTSGWDATASSAGGATTNFNDDILFSNGTFVQYPEGVQTQ
jgi:hypothetical protein